MLSLAAVLIVLRFSRVRAGLWGRLVSAWGERVTALPLHSSSRCEDKEVEGGDSCLAPLTPSRDWGAPADTCPFRRRKTALYCSAESGSVAQFCLTPRGQRLFILVLFPGSWTSDENHLFDECVRWLACFLLKQRPSPELSVQPLR